MTPEEEAIELQKQIIQDVFALCPIKTAEGVRAVANALHRTTYNDKLPAEGPNSMLSAMCLLSGVAMGALSDYAKRLEREEADA